MNNIRMLILAATLSGVLGFGYATCFTPQNIDCARANETIPDAVTLNCGKRPVSVVTGCTVESLEVGVSGELSSGWTEREHATAYCTYVGKYLNCQTNEVVAYFQKTCPTMKAKTGQPANCTPGNG